MLGFCGKYKDPTDIHKSALKIDKICIHIEDLVPMYTSEFSFRVDDYIKEKGYSSYSFIMQEGPEYDIGLETVKANLEKFVKKNPKIAFLSPTSHFNLGYNRTIEELGKDYEKVADILKKGDEKQIIAQAERTKDLIVAFYTFNKNKESVRVLDLGGSSGLHYAALAAVTNSNINVSYTVVERPQECILSTEAWKGYEKHNINFIKEIPADQEFDIVYARASIPYIETEFGENIVNDWEAKLDRLLNLNAEHLVITEFHTSVKEETHLTTQRWEVNFMTPYRVYNREELEAFFLKRGYEAIHTSHRKAEHAFQIRGTDRADDRFMSDYIFKKQRK